MKRFRAVKDALQKKPLKPIIYGPLKTPTTRFRREQIMNFER